MLSAKEVQAFTAGSINNKISSRHMDSYCPRGKFLPAFLIFLPKSLMAEASAFSTNNFFTQQNLYHPGGLEND